MKIARIIAAAVLAVAVPITAIAAPTPFDPGLYQASDHNGVRTVWTPYANSERIVTGNGASRYWSVSNSLLSFDGNLAILSGRLSNNSNTAQGADLGFDFSMLLQVNNAGTPYCTYGNATCAALTPSWTLFTLLTGSLTGIAGTAMDGLTYDITERSHHGPQVGDGANALEANDFGFSMWFNFVRTDGGPTNAGNGYSFWQDGFGDFNMDLDLIPGGNVAPVPLPAGGVLLLGALAGLAAARRRKSTT